MKAIEEMSQAQPAGSYGWVLDITKKVYILLILMTMAFMIPHNLLDLCRKAVSGLGV